MELTLLGLLFILLIPVELFLHGWVISLLWLWFAVPLGVPAITIGVAIGLACLASMFQPIGVMRQWDMEKSSEEKVTKMITAAFLFLFPFSLSAGW